MVSQGSINHQLRKLKRHFRVFGRAEVNELCKILRKTEIIHDCVRGYYQGGSALLVVTSERLLLIDKRPFFVHLEEMSYNRIKDVQFVPKFLQATLVVREGIKVISFRCIRDARLKRISQYIEDMKVDNPQLEQVFVAVKKQFKPYRNPGWRPHNTAYIKPKRAVNQNQTYYQPENTAIAK